MEVGEAAVTNTTLVDGATMRSRRIQAVGEDPQVVVDLLEAGLLFWADFWAETVLPWNITTVDLTNTTCVRLSCCRTVCLLSSCSIYDTRTTYFGR